MIDLTQSEGDPTWRADVPVIRESAGLVFRLRVPGAAYEFILLSQGQQDSPLHTILTVNLAVLPAAGVCGLLIYFSQPPAIIVAAGAAAWLMSITIALIFRRRRA